MTILLRYNNVGATTLSAGVTIDDNVLDAAFGDGELIIGAGSSPVTIDDTGSGPAKLENDVTFHDGSTLAVDPTVVLAGRVTVNGSDQVQASGPDDNVTFDSSSVFAGTGIMTVTGSGTVSLESNLISSVQMVVNSCELDIRGTLLGGDNQIVVNGGTVKLLSGIGGSAGIDVKSGTLVTDQAGIPGYTGTITLEAGGTLKDYDTTDGDGFGKGTLDLKGGTLQSSTGGPARIDNTVTLEGDVTVINQAPISAQQTLASFYLTSTITVNSAETLTANDPTAGEFIVLGTLTGAGPLTITGTGSVVMVTSTATPLILTGTVRDYLAGALTGDVTINDANTVAELVAEDFTGGGNITPLHGTGGIDVQNGTLVSDEIVTNAPGIPGYTGTITLEAGGTLKDYDTTDGDGFGKGTLDLKGGTLQSATGGPARIDNPVTLEGDVTVINQAPISAQQTLASFYLTSTITVDSAETLTANDPTSGEFIVLGTLTGAGPLTITGAGTVLMITSTATPLILTGTVRDYLAGALTGDVTINDANTVAELVAEDFTHGGNITPLHGTGGIDVQNGTLVSDQTVTDQAGIPGYTGTITLEAGGTLKDYDTTDGDGFGKGTLDLKGGTLQSSTGGPAKIDNPVTLEGDVTVINQAPISAQQTLASFYLTSTITVNSAETLTANDPTAGEFIVLGTLTGAGPLTITGTGSVVMVTSTATPLILTGTVRDYLAGALTGDVTINDANTVAELVAEDFTGGGNITPLHGTGGIDVQNGTLVSDEVVSNAPGIAGYTGTISVEAGGTVKDYDSADAFGLGTGNLTLAGGLLQNSSGDTAILSNPATVTGAATISSRGQRFKLANTLNIAAGGSIDVVGTLALPAGITGGGSLALDSDLFAVSGTNPGFTGAIKWNSGIVQVAPMDDPLGTGLMTSLAAQGVLQTENSIDPVMDNPLLVQSGTLTLEGQFTFPGGITVDAGATLLLSGAASQLVDTGTLAGGGNIIVAAGNYSDPGESSAFTGSVQIQGGDTATFAATKLNILAGAAETFNATVTSPTATPTGMVSFFDGATLLGTAALSNGAASLTTATLAFGVHSVTFTYGGDANFSSFNSASVNVFVGSTTNQVIVNALYRQLLNRNAEETQSGLYYWSGLLDSGTPLSKVADGIATSVEYDQDIVTGIYQTYLKRVPDSGGLNAWVGQMQAGTINYETVRGEILGSQEFYNDMINQYGNYLTGLYQILLGRNPDATGIAAWTPAGGAGAWAPPTLDPIRDIVAIGISTSFEQYEDFVGIKFQQFLGRSPSAPTAASLPSAQYVTLTNPNGIPQPTSPTLQGEQGFWADALNTGTSDGDFIADILSSTEYLTDQGLQS